MKSTLFRRIIWFAILGFILLFSFRLWYGYTKKIPDSNPFSFFQEVPVLRQNFASKEYQVKSLQGSGQPSSVSQKYEKIAVLEASTADFDQTDAELRAALKEHEAIIQYEHKNGNAGQRVLHLMIGVQPDRFDHLYQNLIKEIGHIHRQEITKTDKTNEYRELNAKKASLQKIRDALIELKSKGGKIEEYIELEDRILGFERQLQDLGVQLGSYDEENEFCTIKYSLVEKQERKISLIHRVKVALEWTIKMYLRLVLIGGLLVGMTYSV